ncbi:MAG: hypothetical protein K9M44_03615 [Candidatus Pacebacteria bacterium]|nr:hypothetical protein [Candidatus Paceibacterota bacterium]
MNTIKFSEAMIAATEEIARETWPGAIFLRSCYKKLAEVSVMTTIPTLESPAMEYCPKKVILVPAEDGATAMEVGAHFRKLIRVEGVNIIQNFFVPSYMLGTKRVCMTANVKRRSNNGSCSFVVDYHLNNASSPRYEMKIGTPKTDWGDKKWEIKNGKFIAIKKWEKKEWPQLLQAV